MAAADKDMRTEAPIDLDFPVTIDGEKVTSITMRRPKVGDSLKAAKVKGSQGEQIAALFAALVGRPPEFIAELDESDFDKVSEQYARFTGRQAEITTPEN
jgi:hypothetical protein